jgi:hypothetical protein
MPEDNWSLKEFRRKDSPEVGFFRKNLDPNIPPKHPEFTHLAYFTLVYEPRDESGLPSNEDEDILCRIEDSEIDVLATDRLSVLVGTVLKGGIKDLLFYTRNPQEFLRRCEPLRQAYPQFSITCQIAPDPMWNQYYDFP